MHRACPAGRACTAASHVLAPLDAALDVQQVAGAHVCRGAGQERIQHGCRDTMDTGREQRSRHGSTVHGTMIPSCPASRKLAKQVLKRPLQYSGAQQAHAALLTGGDGGGSPGAAAQGEGGVQVEVVQVADGALGGRGVDLREGQRANTKNMSEKHISAEARHRPAGGHSLSRGRAGGRALPLPASGRAGRPAGRQAGCGCVRGQQGKAAFRGLESMMERSPLIRRANYRG